MLTAPHPLPLLTNDIMTKHAPFPRRLPLITLLIGLTTAPLHAATAPVGVVAGSWQTAPGTGYNYNWVGQPRGGQVTDDGIVSFVGNLGGLSAQGLWSGAPGAMSAIALPGQAAPGYTNSTYYGNFFDIQRLDNGQYLFGGSVTSTGQALWKGTAGSLTRILRKGDAVAPGSTTTFGSIEYVANHGSNASDGSYLAWWGPVGNKSSIVIGTPGNYRIAQTTNDQFYSNGWQTMTQLYAPSVSKAGNAVFKADYTQSNQSKSMLRIANMTSTTSLAQEGEAVPGMNGFTWGSNFSSPVINDAGQVLFRGSAQRNFPYDFRSGFWLSNAARTAYTNFARGEQAPGMATGVVLSSGNDYRLNNDGEVAFISRLSGSGVSWDVNDISIWAGAPTALKMAMRLGDLAPGTGGASFASLSWQYGIQQYTNAYQLNDDGQVAFFAQLKGNGVSTSNDIGLWLFDPTAGKSLLIAREGDQIDIGNGSFKTILELYSPYRADAFNNLGQISFGAKFTDGNQAILLSNVVAVPVPEPESWAMLLAGLGLVGFAARQRA